MSKELFMAAHEELVEEYLLEHPDHEWSIVYEETSDLAWDRMKDDMYAQADALRTQEKERPHPLVKGGGSEG